MAINEVDTSTRLLAVAEVVCAKVDREVPEDLRRFKGTMPERRLARMAAATDLLEVLVYEDIEPGLSGLLAGFPLVNVINSKDDELAEIGLSKAQIKRIRDYVGGKSDKPVKQGKSTSSASKDEDGEKGEG